MTTQPTLLRPGILVGFKTNCDGGVRYETRDLDASVEQDELRAGAKTSRWETTKTVDDQMEFERASKTRVDARKLISRACVKTPFGLICPEAYEQELDRGIEQVHALIASFNETANFSRLSVFIMKGRIAASDEMAARAIASEMKDLLSEMNQAIDKLDPEAIREAATKAKTMSAMLQEEQQAKVSKAIEQAKIAARTITKRVNKKGEEGATVIKELQREAIEAARLSFLDFSEVPVVKAGEEMPAVNPNAFDLDIPEDNQQDPERIGELVSTAAFDLDIPEPQSEVAEGV
jgi:HPt (histidine-containing phosphotransfer) domain-containing protein